MIYVLYTLHIIISLFLILVVLLQQGKGADLSVFGGGGTQAAFGPRSATTLLHKLTVWGFVAFTVMTISIGFLTGRERGESVMEGVETEQSAPATPAEEPATEPEATPQEGEPAAPDNAAEPAEPAAAPAPEETAPPAGGESEESADEPPR